MAEADAAAAAAKDAQLKDLRTLFTAPEMLTEDGEINQEYFRPKRALHRNQEWSESDDDLLLQGIAQYGVGEWKLISDELLPLWEPYELRDHAARLFGHFKVTETYKGWKVERDIVEKEYAKNKEEAMAEGMWHPKLKMRMPVSVPFQKP
mmetsp:Transcript_29249/g.75342  ORF Transcript_29249/g.75342 Transcript_29249/m.75342 type:complete len:150 (-) Transcript_29249:1546-1995(-)